jgi:hypothetical protein
MRVRKGQKVKYVPNGWDTLDPKTNLKPGDIVRVTHCHGCPPPNTMNHCHVETLDGVFIGLVHCNSLEKP